MPTPATKTFLPMVFSSVPLGLAPWHVPVDSLVAGQAEHPLGHLVAEDLRRPPLDGVGPGPEEGVGPHAGVGVPRKPGHAGHPGGADGEIGAAPVVLGVHDLVYRPFRT